MNTPCPSLTSLYYPERREGLAETDELTTTLGPSLILKYPRAGNTRMYSLASAVGLATEYSIVTSQRGVSDW